MLSGAAFAKERSVIVGFRQKPGLSEKAMIRGTGGRVKRMFKHIPAIAADLSEEAVDRLKKNGQVAYVEEDGVFMAVEPAAGNEFINAWGVKHIGADAAHASGNRGTGIKIGIIDTGIDYTHEDLNDNYAGGWDFVFNDEDPFDDNPNSHGTHVAGIIAAEDNGIGVIGVAPEADIYAIKVLDGAGFGLLSWIIAGLEWAVNNHMDVVNLSLEGQHYQSLMEACDSAYNAGVLLVAAGGNTYGGNPRYPAAYGSVIAATATDAQDVKAYFSPVGSGVELSAPGLNILSTCSLTQQSCAGSGGYRVLSGTSQAAPHITGTAALLLSTDLQDVNGDGMINGIDVRPVLQSTAVDLGEPGRDATYGFGLVNASAAVLPPDVLQLTIVRNNGKPAADAETVTLGEGVNRISIVNNGLRRIKIDVYEDGVYHKALTSSYRFGRRQPQEVTFNMDAGIMNYDVTFTPFGKRGTSADIVISAE
ncbi:MAG: S8 family peptidase [Nitrospirota bacterium]